MKLILISVVLIGLFGSAANADSIKGNFPACTTEELYDQLLTAINKKDKEAMDWLLNNGCFMPKAGLHVMRISGFITVKVRAFVGKKSIVFFTAVENLQGD